MKVLITPRGFANYGMDQIALLKAQGLEVHYNATGKQYTEDEFQSLARDVDAIIVGVDKMDKAMIEGCPNLKVVCKFGVGTDNIDLDFCKERGIYCGRTVGSNALTVAEHVIAMMFMEAKNMYTSIRDVKSGLWLKPTGFEIHNKIMGIIGFGMIGKHLADIAYGLGMKIYVYDVNPIQELDAQKHHVIIKSLDELLECSDYLSLHVPLLASTKNMISESSFKKMKSSACLINAARGGIVDEEALYQALIHKEIRSACFDVYSKEPPMHDDLLLALDNFLLTPHTAARTVESEQRTCAMTTQIILEQLIGRK